MDVPSGVVLTPDGYILFLQIQDGGTMDFFQ
jgi:hypothetical protein